MGTGRGMGGGSGGRRGEGGGEERGGGRGGRREGEGEGRKERGGGGREGRGGGSRRPMGSSRSTAAPSVHVLGMNWALSRPQISEPSPEDIQWAVGIRSEVQ